MALLNVLHPELTDLAPVKVVKACHKRLLADPLIRDAVHGRVLLAEGEDWTVQAGDYSAPSLLVCPGTLVCPSSGGGSYMECGVELVLLTRPRAHDDTDGLFRMRILTHVIRRLKQFCGVLRDNDDPDGQLVTDLILRWERIPIPRRETSTGIAVTAFEVVYGAQITEALEPDP